MAAGQMAAAGWEGRLLSGQVFSADAAIEWLTGQTKSARQAGFPGLRVAVDMSWPPTQSGTAQAAGPSTASTMARPGRPPRRPLPSALPPYRPCPVPSTGERPPAPWPGRLVPSDLQLATGSAVLG